MAGGLRGLLHRSLWLLLATQLFTVTAYQDTDYSTLIQEQCLARFKENMEAVGRTLWCDWGKTIGSYGDLTDCTRSVADKLGRFWPNAEVDKFFIAIHQRYFSGCPVSGRIVRDPPSTILCPFIVVPITVTLLMTMLVVWRSKRTESIV
ncbi:receptor activity-modifying protein 1 [Dipodomys spectabilis]|uniref:receptor activity-modifying protein 1 n=1 Tax=Dipodomys spectabilis TaxID=105255 RepID=UPI001C54A1E0|nr:receptor activity-modifying protein 1 [Dipodomys spectabilis]